MTEAASERQQPEDVIWSYQQLLREPSPNYCEILTCLTFKGWIMSGGLIPTWNSGCTCSAQHHCSCSMPVSLQCALLSGAGHMLLQWCTILVHSCILDAGPPRHTTQIPRTRSVSYKSGLMLLWVGSTHLRILSPAHHCHFF